MRLIWQWSLFVVAILSSSEARTGLAFAGSPSRARRHRDCGVDVSGLTAGEARATCSSASQGAWRNDARRLHRGGQELARQAERSRRRRGLGGRSAGRSAPGRRFRPAPRAQAPRRARLRRRGRSDEPVYQYAVDAYIARFARAVDRPRVEPSLRLTGYKARVAPGRNGRVIDQAAAEKVLVQGLTSLAREPVPLPLKIDRTHLTTRDLAGAEVKADTALSAPADIAYGAGGWHLSQRKIARLLALPKNGETDLQLAGPQADRFFKNLRKRVEHAPRDARFAIGARNVVRVVPAQAGRKLDKEGTTRNIMAALLSSSNRKGDLKVATAAPERTTRDAKAMGITGLVGAYETFYGGVPNRIHNVQLVAHLIDDHYIAPGETFSFNGTTGDRSEDKGFLEAPVIINGELKTGLGGGVCQVSTTTFNAAYEAGLSITDRTNHALYISHYPLGRDATVNYPDTDLKFVNDTGHWLWLRTFVGSSSLTVALYGTPQNRKVESEVAPLEVTGSIPVKRVADPAMTAGTEVVEEVGAPPRSTHVRRQVFDSDGKLMYDHTWYSTYVAEPEVIRYGTKPKPEPPPPPPPKKKTPPPPPPPPSPPPAAANG